MALFLEITDGPQKGTRFHVFNGVKIGRSVGEIVLDDPKVSALHAQFEVDARGALSLVDRGSANGLHISGQSVQRIRMLPGVRFRVGKTHFLVIKDDSIIDEPPISGGDLQKPQKWKNTLKNRIPQLASSNQVNPETISAFPNIVELVFIRGAQLNQKITLGYGPRRVGRDGLDIEIFEPSCPDVAFELRPAVQNEHDPDAVSGIAFQTKYPQVVTLNGENRFGRHLKHGDLIQIGSTTIEVRIL